jgi:hypothetical protein
MHRLSGRRDRSEEAEAAEEEEREEEGSLGRLGTARRIRIRVSEAFATSKSRLILSLTHSFLCSGRRVMLRRLTSSFPSLPLSILRNDVMTLYDTYHTFPLSPVPARSPNNTVRAFNLPLIHSSSTSILSRSSASAATSSRSLFFGR